jgi:hypothetical protein
MNSRKGTITSLHTYSTSRLSPVSIEVPSSLSPLQQPSLKSVSNSRRVDIQAATKIEKEENKVNWGERVLIA